MLNLLFIKKRLRENLNMGYSFPLSRSNAIEDYLTMKGLNISNKTDVKNILKKI